MLVVGAYDPALCLEAAIWGLVLGFAMAWVAWRLGR